MILNSAPQAEAVLSNVGEIGEFRIRNSAKAFNILSSGLYANKIKAIVRELSCNAVDSHTAAGNPAPFEVHLPTSLEPYFSIRDFGTGLSHDQVTNIYTTYFESTKTGSNDYIGALGLGSKSPFSYTDNFTVTAIKDGRKGIYTAFINDAGVPSIALMAEEQTDEPSGVEVRFAVASQSDNHKFSQEAQAVYQYFKLKPTIKGAHVQINDIEYESKNIIPGVHSYGGSKKSRAIMGNIAYPIEVPNNALGKLGELLSCGLEMHFDIGELDFQASREGLSYIPQTIEAIRNKLEALNAALTVVLTKEADAIENKWKRSIFLYGKKRVPLWYNAVSSYVKANNFELFEVGSYQNHFQNKVNIVTLRNQFNIEVRGFRKGRHDKTCSSLTPGSHYEDDPQDPTKRTIVHHYEFDVADYTIFIKNDTKIGAAERAKYHWRNLKDQKHTNEVYVLSVSDKSKPALFDAFFQHIGNPPAEQIMYASALDEKPRNGGIGKNVSILYLEQKTRRGSWRDTTYVSWTATKFGDLDPTETYYYVPLKGYELITKYGNDYSVAYLREMLIESGIPDLEVTVYGVRKGDIEQIKTQKNWVNLEDHIAKVLSNIPQSVIDGMAKRTVESNSTLAYVKAFYTRLDNNNPMFKLIARFAKVKSVAVRTSAVKQLADKYAKNTTFDPSVHIANIEKECDNIVKRYPLLNMLNSYTSRSDNSAVLEYIEMIDKVKGV